MWAILKFLGFKQPPPKCQGCKKRRATVHYMYDGGRDLCDQCNRNMLAEGCD